MTHKLISLNCEAKCPEYFWSVDYRLHLKNNNKTKTAEGDEKNKQTFGLSCNAENLLNADKGA